ncbi:MAG: MFS transporter, partial [Candidatus Binatia bacterium]
ALARVGGPAARRPMSQITFLGGLSVVIFWPMGQMLARHFVWRGALLVYGAFALATIPLHLAIPNTHYEETLEGHSGPRQAPLARNPRECLVAGSLYTVVTTLASFLNSGLSPNILLMLGSFGLPVATALWVSVLRGVGQSSARLCDIMFGKNTQPLMLNLLGALVLPLCFGVGLLSGQFIIAAVILSFFSGVGNGIAAITRGTLPLVLFDHRTYGALTGRLLAPSFLLSAVAPVTYASVIEGFGGNGALYLSMALALLMLMAAIALKVMFSAGKEVGASLEI